MRRAAENTGHQEAHTLLRASERHGAHGLQQHDDRGHGLGSTPNPPTPESTLDNALNGRGGLTGEGDPAGADATRGSGEVIGLDAGPLPRTRMDAMRAWAPATQAKGATPAPRLMTARARQPTR